MRTNNKCILGFAYKKLLFVRTKAAPNGCKRTLWKKNSYGIYYINSAFIDSTPVLLSSDWLRLKQRLMQVFRICQHIMVEYSLETGIQCTQLCSAYYMFVLVPFFRVIILKPVMIQKSLCLDIFIICNFE